MDFWTWLASCPVKYEVDSLQGFDGVSVAFYPPTEDEEDNIDIDLDGGLSAVNEQEQENENK
jgi:hypothetical protein